MAIHICNATVAVWASCKRATGAHTRLQGLLVAQRETWKWDLIMPKRVNEVAIAKSGYISIQCSSNRLRRRAVHLGTLSLSMDVVSSSYLYLYPSVHHAQQITSLCDAL